MKTVWVVLECEPYEGCLIRAICADESSAIKFKGNKYSYDIEEWFVLDSSDIDIETENNKGDQDETSKTSSGGEI